MTKFSRGFALVAIAALSACGGGGGGDTTGPTEVLVFDESAPPVSTWTPSTTTVTVNNTPTQVYLFPLALHERTMLRSYVSKVGTTSQVRERVTGTMTTPSVANGAYSAIRTTTRGYGASVLFEGLSATPVTVTSAYSSVMLAGQAMADSSSVSTSYYDTTFGIYLGYRSATSYAVINPNASTSLPELVAPGDAGDFLVYTLYADATKAAFIGNIVQSYRILNVSAITASQYKARIEWTSRTYSAQNLLLGLSTYVYDITYSVTTGATVNLISATSDDVSGTTTWHLTYTKI